MSCNPKVVQIVSEFFLGKNEPLSVNNQRETVWALKTPFLIHKYQKKNQRGTFLKQFQKQQSTSFPIQTRIAKYERGNLSK